MKHVLRIEIFLLCIPGVIGATPAEAESALPDSLDVHSSILWETIEADPGTFVQMAIQAYQQQNFETAAEYFIAAIQANLNNAPIVMYNLACCYGLLDRPELAGRAVLESIRAGFTDLELLEADPDFALVKEDSIFIAYVETARIELLEKMEQQSDETLGKRGYIEFPSMQFMRVQLPEDYDPDQEYRLVIALHGYGGDVTEFSLRYSAFTEQDFILACLQAPYAFLRGNRLAYSWIPHGTNQWEESTIPHDVRAKISSSALKLSMDLILAAAEDLTDEYNINGIVVMGFSQGGVMAYLTCINHPFLFEGIASFSGILDESLYSPGVIEEGNSLPVFAGRGSDEDDRSLHAVNVLSGYGYDVTLFEWEGGHFIPDESLEAFEEWMRHL